MTVNFLAGSPGGLHIFSLYLEDLRVMVGSSPVSTGVGGLPLPFDNTDDILFFGGAGTKMYNLRIFSPGSRLVIST